MVIYIFKNIESFFFGFSKKKKSSSSLSPPSSQNINHHHQTYLSQYHNTASPPTSLQRRRFQLNSNYTVTLPPLELDFKEVIRQAEDEWKTGRSQDIQTFSSTASTSTSSPLSNNNNSNNNKKKKKSVEKDNDDDIQKEVDKNDEEAQEVFNMLSTMNNKKPLQPLSDFSLIPVVGKTTTTSSSRSPSKYNVEVSTRRDHTMKHKIGEGVSPSLGLTGEEIVKIRETVKSSRDLLASVPKMRLAPPPSDLKLPNSARQLNLPPMKL